MVEGAAPLMSTATLDDTKPEIKIVEDATCTFCGCVCDDIDLTVEGQPHHRGQARLRPREGLVLQPHASTTAPVPD